jgi:hypothetical protein
MASKKHRHGPACIVTKGSSVACKRQEEGLHDRIAKALGWSVSDTRSFSLAALRDLVRPVSAKLAHDITTAIQSGSVLL